VGKLLVDALGFHCPLPILMVTAKVKKQAVHAGDVMEVIADCDSFEKDIRAWCEQHQKVLIFLRNEENGVKRCQIRI
jgi:TusA-related sulfurtransferase